MEHIKELFAALTTPMIAIIGLWIAYQQFRLQRYRFRKDINELRLSVFFAVKELLQAGLNSRPKIESVDKFNLAVSGAPFLFKPEVTKYLDELRERFLVVWDISEQQTEKDFPDDEIQKGRLKERREQRQWMRSQLGEAERVFKRYLDLSSV